MKVLKSEILSRPAGDFNEDIAALYNSAAWVLDGSSSLVDRVLTPEISDGKWFVQEWNTYLEKNIENYNQDIKSILSGGVEYIRDIYQKIVKSHNVDPLRTPSSAIALTRFYRDQLELFVLGDCTLVLNTQGYIRSFSDNKIDEFDDFVIKKIYKHQIQDKLTFKTARERELPLLQKHRSLKNMADGYWILGFDNGAIAYGIHDTVKVTEKISVLLMSDGFSRLVKPFGVVKKVDELLPLAKKDGLISLYERLREIETRDINCLRYPRLKPKDDVSAILIELNID